jgi:hypothetical protein
MVHCATSFVCNRLEDQFFALHLGIVGGRVPDERTAGRFAVETVVVPDPDDGESRPPVGVHQPHRHLAPLQLKALHKSCRAAKRLADTAVEA